MKHEVAIVTVAGQFEDPEDEETPLYTQWPKRSRRNEDANPVEPPVTGPSVPASTPQAAAPTVTTSHRADPVASVVQMPHPSPVMIPSCMIPVPMAMMPHIPQPLHPMAAAAWQQQQTFLMSHMMTMMNPVMQQMQNQFMHHLVTNTNAPPGSRYVPPHVNVKRQPLQPQQEQSPGLGASKQSSQADNEWRIPYSHNYHPQTGFLQENIISTSADNNAHTVMSSRTKSKKYNLEMMPLRELPILKDSQFPLIPEDTAKEFGLSDWEVTSTDVLCGRGGVTNSHKGNIYFRNLANQLRWDYATVKKSRKAHVAKVIVRKIRERHGRFLKKDGDSWYEIGDELALTKAAQTLREGLAKMYRDGLKSKRETNRRTISVKAAVATSARVTPMDDTGSQSDTSSAGK